MRDLLCFARGRPGDWEGICLDFDIAVQGRSFEEVRDALAEAVSDYVAAAHAEDAVTCSKLLNRRAPIWEHLLWSWRVLLSAWRHKSNGDTSASFPVAYPA